MSAQSVAKSDPKRFTLRITLKIFTSRESFSTSVNIVTQPFQVEISFIAIFTKCIKRIINKSSQISGITDPDELYQFIRRDAENGKFFCTICNLMGHPKRSNVRNHIECKHFKDAFIYSCDLCSYTSNTKDALQRHRRKHDPTNI